MAFYILVAMLLGIGVGHAVNLQAANADAAARVAGHLSILSDVFLRLIKMLIGPLVFSTLVVGIAHMGDARSVGRLFGKAFAWFMAASAVSLGLGFLLANLMQPGQHLGLPLPDVHAAVNLKTSGFTLKDFITHLVPRSFAEAMADNEILQIVVFSMFFGVALASLGEAGRALTAVVDQLAHVMLKITGYVMKMAPVAVFAAMAATVATHGVGILLKFAVFMGEFYFALLVLWCLLLLGGFAFLGRRTWTLVKMIREPFLLAFATASSEAAYPRILDALDRFGVQRRISSFVLPLGYSFNLDGSMIYCSFATLFIAQAYGIHLPIGTQLAMMAVLMLTSKGIAGVPRASLVVIAATLGQFGIPESGLLLILGVDTFLDMGRSATNAVGNSVAAAVVAQSEGALLSEAEAAHHAAHLDAEKAQALGERPAA